jgi:hypothetical protein
MKWVPLWTVSLKRHLMREIAMVRNARVTLALYTGLRTVLWSHREGDADELEDVPRDCT